MMKVIIAGGRYFDNYPLLVKSCDHFFKGQETIEIVSGGAKGADALGEQYASESKLKQYKFPANWNMYGKAAGPIRNEEMGDFADALVAFWDGESKGTMHMIKYMKKLGKPVRIVIY